MAMCRLRPRAYQGASSKRTKVDILHPVGNPGLSAGQIGGVAAFL